jgi:hypothetical protein
MTTAYPTGLDAFTNPTATSTLVAPSHADQHADANDAIEALEAKVGITSSAVVTSLDYIVRNLPATNITSGVVAGQYGGTGIANTGKTITIGGNFTTSGAFTTTLTATGNTSVTLPVSGTLATSDASSLTTGTLPTARMVGAYTSITSVGTLTTLAVAGTVSRGAPVTKTASFTLADTENWVICAGTASITVTLPAASAQSGRELTIKNIAAFTVVSASSNIVPIGSATAGTAILPATVGAWVTLVSNGTNWVVMQT